MGTMNTSTNPLSSSNLPERGRGIPESQSFRRGRTETWKPGASRGVSRAVIGVCGAALVGALAVGGILLSPSRTAKPVAQPQADIAATAPAAPASASADGMANQLQQEPTAAGTTPQATPPTGNGQSQESNSSH